MAQIPNGRLGKGSLVNQYVLVGTVPCTFQLLYIYIYKYSLKVVSHCLPQTTISRKQLLFQPQAPQLALSPTLSTFAGDGTQAVKESHFEWIPDAFSVDFFRDGQKKG